MKNVLKVCSRAYLFLFFLIICNGYSQENSQEYLSIKNDTLLSESAKEIKIDSLFKLHKEQEDKRMSLAYDTYDYIIWNYRKGALDKAIEMSKKGIEIVNSLQTFDSLKHKKIYNNLGFFYIRKGDYFNAYKTYEKLTKVGKLDSYTARAYQLTGRALTYLGDFYKAAEYYEKSVDIGLEIGDFEEAIGNSIDASINYKQIDTKEGHERGIELLKKALLLAVDVNENADSDQEKLPSNLLFSLYNNLANLYSDRDDYDFKNSKYYFDKSLSIAQELKDSVLLSIVYNDFGYLYVHEAQPQALKYLEKAQLHKPDKKLTSVIYANKGLYFQKQNDRKKAMQYTQQAINELTPANIDDFGSLPSKEDVSKCSYKFALLQSLVDKAKLWIDIYETTSTKESLLNSLETLKLADYLVDDIRFESSAQQSKLFWRRTASEIYSNAVKTCFYLNNTKDGFYFMEKNKAILLLEDVSLRQQRELADIPEGVHNRYDYLKKQLIKFSLSNHSTDLRESSKDSLLKVQQAYDYFVDSLEKENRFIFKINQPQKPLPVYEAKEHLAANEGYIAYILGDSNGYGILITNDDNVFFEIDAYDTLKERSERFRGFLESPIQREQDQHNFARVGLSLYNSLFPEKILDKVKNKKLVIIPDSYLQNIPFEALNTTEDYGDFLLKQNEINYAYSISFLIQNRAWKRDNSKNFIGFAPVSFKENYSDLPYSEKEMEVGSSLSFSMAYLFEKATKKNFSQNIKDFKIVHLASHAEVNDSDESWILFDDGKLSLNELFLTRNTADLVVLSACNTSLGKLYEGEGVMSLARGFFNTGAQSVLSTLWSTNDKSSFEITSNFYKNIKKGKTKSEALHLAKLDYLNTHDLSELSPYYWSSFVLIGDAGKIPLQSDSRTLFILLSLFLVLVVGLLIFFKKKK